MAVDLLNRIMDGIKSGTLKHIQDAYHCGTAHCFAGWVEVFKLLEIGKYNSIDTEWTSADDDILSGNTWDFAKKELGLYDAEACVLFSSYSTKELQQACVNYINQGVRITRCPDITIVDDKMIINGTNFTQLEGLKWLISHCSKNKHC